jgi:hypothetical protein
MPSGAVYYFSSCAFFVAMPFVLALAATWLGQWNNGNSFWRYAIAASIIMSAVGYGAITEKLAQRHRTVPVSANQVVSTLERLRVIPVEKDRIAAPSDDLLERNPIERISARPFLYPAVSERMWTGVLDESPEALNEYQYYGYADYLTTDGTGLRRREPSQGALTVYTVDLAEQTKSQ